MTVQYVMESEKINQNSMYCVCDNFMFDFIKKKEFFLYCTSLIWPYCMSCQAIAISPIGNGKGN